MFFGLTRADFSLFRWKSALPFFLLIFFSFLALVSIFTETLKFQITHAELYETRALLDKYLQENRSARLQFAPAFPADSNQMSGLSFIRVSRGGDRLLLASDHIPPDLFKELLHFEVKDSEVWLRRVNEKREYVWTVVNKKLESGYFILAAKNSRISYEKYQSIVRAAYLSLALGLPLACFTALFCVKRMLSPVTKLQKELDQLADKKRGQLLEATGHGNEVRELYERINRLITQNRKLVDEMQSSLDSVAHDLRTPMTRLRSVAEFGLREESDTRRLKESLADCLEESERVLSMLRIMMSVAEAETGTVRLEKKVVSLPESVAEMIGLYEYVAEEKKITIDATFPDDVYILADPTRISQVWANLLDNAIKYGREGGQVTVEAKIFADVWIEVHFRDDGMGISPNEQKRIWDRLYRGDRSRSEQGLGLGLNYVKAMVESHGGSVSVLSELYRGSCFTVRLPRYVATDFSGSREKSQTSGE